MGAGWKDLMCIAQDVSSDVWSRVMVRGEASQNEDEGTREHVPAPQHRPNRPCFSDEDMCKTGACTWVKI